jgi:hypothetical protein
LISSILWFIFFSMLDNESSIEVQRMLREVKNVVFYYIKIQG